MATMDLHAEELLPLKENTDPESGRIIESILRSTRPQKFLEIGSCRGDGAEVWIKTLSEWGGKYIGIESSQGNLQILLEKVSKYDNATIIPGHSQERVIFDQAKAHAPFDFIYVDGSHEVPMAMIDIEMYSELLIKDGIMAVHDALDFEFPTKLFPLQKVFNNYILIPTFRHPARYGVALLQQKKEEE